MAIERPTLPSVQSRREQLEMAIRQGRVREIAGLPEALHEHEQAMAKLESAPFVSSEKLRRRNEAEMQLRAKVAELVTAARTAALREFDQAEGELRRKLRTDGAQASDVEIRSQVFRSQRAQALTSRADRATSAAAALDVFREAELSQDSEVIRLTGIAVQARLDTLGLAEKHKTVTPIRNQAEQHRQAFGAWLRENPSPTARLDAIERGRAQMEILFEASAAFALDLFRVGRSPQAPALKPLPEPPVGSRSGLVFGSYFDQIRGRK